MSVTYLSTSFTTAFIRGMCATSAAPGTSLSPSTDCTSALRDACTLGWRESSYKDQDRVLEIWDSGEKSWDDQTRKNICFENTTISSALYH